MRPLPRILASLLMAAPVLAAAASLKARASSGANGVDPYWPEPAPGAFAYPAVERGRLWAKMTPWVMKTPDELRPPPLPALDSEQFLRAL
ncbi:MAG: hypothetical protein ACKO7G_15430 [Gammaproteobacteria bacterium]